VVRAWLRGQLPVVASKGRAGRMALDRCDSLWKGDHMPKAEMTGRERLLSACATRAGPSAHLSAHSCLRGLDLTVARLEETYTPNIGPDGR